MPYRKTEDGNIEEYRVIPERIEVVRTYTPEQFDAYQAQLQKRVDEFDGKVLAAKVLAAQQAKVDEVIAAKAEVITVEGEVIKPGGTTEDGKKK